MDIVRCSLYTARCTLCSVHIDIIICPEILVQERLDNNKAMLVVFCSFPRFKAIITEVSSQEQI